MNSHTERRLIEAQEGVIRSCLGVVQFALRESTCQKAHDCADIAPVEALEILAHCVESGVFPTWEVLERIAAGWHAYSRGTWDLERSRDGESKKHEPGDLSLGDAFAGAGKCEPRRKARKKAFREARNFELFLTIENKRQTGECESLDSAVEKTILDFRLVEMTFHEGRWIAKDPDELDRKIESLKRDFQRAVKGSLARSRQKALLDGEISDGQKLLRELVGIPLPRKST